MAILKDLGAAVLSQYTVLLLLVLVAMVGCSPEENASSDKRATGSQKDLSPASISPGVRAILSEMKRGEEDYMSQPLQEKKPRVSPEEFEKVVQAIGQRADLVSVEFDYSRTFDEDPPGERNIIKFPRGAKIMGLDNKYSHFGSVLVQSGFEYKFEFHDRGIGDSGSFEFWKKQMLEPRAEDGGPFVVLVDMPDLFFIRQPNMSPRTPSGYWFVMRVRHDGFVRFVSMPLCHKDYAPQLEDALLMIHCFRTWSLKREQ